MAFDIEEIMEKLKAIEGFAKNVSETKKLADELAKNFASMKEALNKTMNESFTEIANQIDTLRKNMERMEEMGTVEATTSTEEEKPSPTPKAPEPELEPEPTPQESTLKPPEVEEVDEPEPEVPPEEPPIPEPTEAEELEAEEPIVEEPTAEEPTVEEPAEESGELDLLIQQQDQVKAKLTDLRFDYMRGYIPEDEYKQKESELDDKLEELDRKIADLK
ncbi:MAG: hypothetical protein ACOC3C_04850 [Candidatus Thorarchaeota archaeon]